MKKLFIFLLLGIFLIGFGAPAAFVPSNNIIGYWSFDEGAGDTNYNIHNPSSYNLTAFTGNPYWVKGKLGPWGMQFNGSDSLSVDYTASGIGNFSWSVWINATQVDSTQCILLQNDDSFGLQDLCIRSGNLEFRVGDGSANRVASIALVANRTYHIAAVANGSDKLYLYLNGTNVANSSAIGQVKGGLSPFVVGSNDVETEHFIGFIDEVGYWNKALGVQDVSELYRDGLGKAYPNRSIISGLISPTHLFGFSNQNVNFNFTGFSGANQFNLTNATLLIYNSTGLFNSTNISLTGNSSNNSMITVNNLNVGQYTWNVYVCGINNTGTQCNTNLINYSLFVGAMVNSNLFNSSTYETSLESFKTNISLVSGLSISSVNLNYNGNVYSGTSTNIGGNDYFINSAINIPTGVQTNNWFWSLLYSNNIQQNLTSNTQSVSLINLSICGSAPQNVKYINFTFKNETSAQERVNASISSSTWTYWLGSGSITKSLSYSNANENREYTFCFSPQDKSVYTDVTLNYDNAESEQRSYAPSTLTLTNNTNLKTLYLLPTLQGQYVTFQVINTAQQALEGVNVVVTRSGIGTVETATTDSSGSVTFFLNPNFAYSFTFSKTGFTDFETEITPSQTAYTITMGGTSSATNVTNPQRGITYSVLPSIKTLNNGTTYNFNLTLNASYWTLDSWGFTLQNRSGYVLASQSSTASSGGFLGTNLNTGQNKTITMNYFWVINGQYNNATITWTVIALSGNTFSIFQFFTDLITYVTVGFFGLDEFGLALLTFFTIFIITGVMSYKFGINSPAAIMGFIFSLVLFFDVGLGLVPNPVGAIPHAPTFLIGLILVAMVFREVGR